MPPTLFFKSNDVNKHAVGHLAGYTYWHSLGVIQLHKELFKMALESYDMEVMD